MSRFTTPYRLLVAFVAAVASVVLALSMTSPGTAAPGAASHVPGKGTNDFGMTHAFLAGHKTNFTYSHGYFCDTSVPSKATTKCEVGPEVEGRAEPSARPAVHHGAARVRSQDESTARRT